MWPTIAALLTVGLLVALAAPAAAVDPPPAVQYYRLVPGTPTESGSVFHVPVFVLGEPAGSPANVSYVRQVWEDLSILYLNSTPSTFGNWSVPTWGAGRFDLRLVITPGEVTAIETGQALLALNSSIKDGTTLYGAAGQIDGPTLSSSIVLGAWWNTLFDIRDAPPVGNPRSIGDVLSDLAWFGSSTAGRALYAAVTLCAVLLYLNEAGKLARERVAAKKERAAEEASDDRD